MGFIKLSAGQKKYIPLVVNHREISGTVEGGRGEGERREKQLVLWVGNSFEKA